MWHKSVVMMLQIVFNCDVHLSILAPVANELLYLSLILSISPKMLG